MKINIKQKQNPLNTPPFLTLILLDNTQTYTHINAHTRACAHTQAPIPSLFAHM